MEDVLNLSLVMDQGWAMVYQINDTSFLGIVRLAEKTEYKGNTLISLNTRNVDIEHDRVSNLEVYSLTNIKHFADISLNSFFFKDAEGHDFEIQQFLIEKDIAIFG
jgi:hypothetical protein